MLTKEECLELVAFAKEFMKNRKFTGGATHEDIAHDIISANKGETLEESKQLLGKFCNASQEDARKARMTEEKEDKRRRACKQRYDENMLDPAFRKKRNVKNSVQAKKLRKTNPAWREKERLRSRKNREKYKMAKESALPQICRLPEKKCIRKPERRNKVLQTTCPFQNLFCLKGGMCLPKQDAEGKVKGET